jgi:hypothetical protein
VQPTHDAENGLAKTEAEDRRTEMGQTQIKPMRIDMQPESSAKGWTTVMQPESSAKGW